MLKKTWKIVHKKERKKRKKEEDVKENESLSKEVKENGVEVVKDDKALAKM